MLSSTLTLYVLARTTVASTITLTDTEAMVLLMLRHSKAIATVDMAVMAVMAVTEDINLHTPVVAATEAPVRRAEVSSVPSQGLWATLRAVS